MLASWCLLFSRVLNTCILKIRVAAPALAYLQI
jgi:hypothetical protein